MSHIATIKTEIKDLAAVKALCKENGWEFRENKTEYRGLGWKGKCTHAIGLKGVSIELGLILGENGSFTLGFDEDLTHDIKSWNGGKSYIGAGAGKFLQQYAVIKTELEARNRGWLTTRRQVGAKVQVVVTGM